MTDDNPLLAIQKLKKTFGGLVALEDVTLDVYQGEMLGLIGPNGAGKSTLMNLITGVLPVTSGSIYFKDEDVTGLAKHKIANRGIIRTFQESRHFHQFTGRENIRVANTNGRLLSWEIPFSALRVNDSESEIMRTVISETGLSEEELSKTPGEMSHLEHVKLSIARAFVNEPEILMLDEPFAGLTSEEVETVADIISRLNEQQMTIIVIDHNVQMVSEIVNRMAILDQGTILLEGDPEMVVNDDLTLSAYFGE